ncbi:MAG: alanine racemase [Eubacteriales bacterium]
MKHDYYITYADLPVSGNPRAWVEVDASAIRHNYRRVLAGVTEKREGCRIIAVIKGDAYGHGITECTRIFLSEGCRGFALANLEEALCTKRVCDEEGVTADILILGATDPSLISDIAKHDIIQTIPSFDYAKRLSHAASDAGVTVRTHIKLDTGMNRLGFPTFKEEQKNVTAAQIAQISHMEGIVIDGVFSHFASADEVGEHAEYRTELQSIRFFDTLDRIRLEGVNPRVVHLCNSPGAFTRPSKDLGDAVRIGISLFGFGPAPGIDIGLRPTFRLCAKISRISKLTPGEELGYGGTYKVEKETNCATVGIGYADGVFRHAAGHRVSVYSPDGSFKGMATIIGRVCMDMCMLDLGDTDAEEGDVVVFFGDEHVTCLDFALHCNTIVHECLSRISGRVPRIVVNDD